MGGTRWPALQAAARSLWLALICANPRRCDPPPRYNRVTPAARVRGPWGLLDAGSRARAQRERQAFDPQEFYWQMGILSVQAVDY